MSVGRGDKGEVARLFDRQSDLEKHRFFRDRILVFVEAIAEGCEGFDSVDFHLAVDLDREGFGRAGSDMGGNEPEKIRRAFLGQVEAIFFSEGADEA